MGLGRDPGAVTRDVLHHLLDGIEPELLVALRALAAAGPGVTAVLGARGRWTGRSVRLEVTIVPAPGGLACSD